MNAIVWPGDKARFDVDQLTQQKWEHPCNMPQLLTHARCEP